MSNDIEVIKRLYQITDIPSFEDIQKQQQLKSIAHVCSENDCPLNVKFDITEKMRPFRKQIINPEEQSI